MDQRNKHTKKNNNERKFELQASEIIHEDGPNNTNNLKAPSSGHQDRESNQERESEPSYSLGQNSNALNNSSPFRYQRLQSRIDRSFREEIFKIPPSMPELVTYRKATSAGLLDTSQPPKRCKYSRRLGNKLEPSLKTPASEFDQTGKFYSDFFYLLKKLGFVALLLLIPAIMTGMNNILGKHCLDSKEITQGDLDSVVDKKIKYYEKLVHSQDITRRYKFLGYFEWFGSMSMRERQLKRIRGQLRKFCRFRGFMAPEACKIYMPIKCRIRFLYKPHWYNTLPKEEPVLVRKHLKGKVVTTKNTWVGKPKASSSSAVSSSGAKINKGVAKKGSAETGKSGSKVQPHASTGGSGDGGKKKEIKGKIPKTSAVDKKKDETVKKSSPPPKSSISSSKSKAASPAPSPSASTKTPAKSSPKSPKSSSSTMKTKPPKSTTTPKATPKSSSPSSSTKTTDKTPPPATIAPKPPKKPHPHKDVNKKPTKSPKPSKQRQPVKKPQPSKKAQPVIPIPPTSPKDHTQPTKATPKGSTPASDSVDHNKDNKEEDLCEKSFRVIVKKTYISSSCKMTFGNRLAISNIVDFADEEKPFKMTLLWFLGDFSGLIILMLFSAYSQYNDERDFRRDSIRVTELDTIVQQGNLDSDSNSHPFGIADERVQEVDQAVLITGLKKTTRTELDAFMIEVRSKIEELNTKRFGGGKKFEVHEICPIMDVKSYLKTGKKYDQIIMKKVKNLYRAEHSIEDYISRISQTERKQVYLFDKFKNVAQEDEFLFMKSESGKSFYEIARPRNFSGKVIVNFKRKFGRSSTRRFLSIAYDFKYITKALKDLKEPGAEFIETKSIEHGPDNIIWRNISAPAPSFKDYFLFALCVLILSLVELIIFEVIKVNFERLDYTYLFMNEPSIIITINTKDRKTEFDPTLFQTSNLTSLSILFALKVTFSNLTVRIRDLFIKDHFYTQKSVVENLVPYYFGVYSLLVIPFFHGVLTFNYFGNGGLVEMVNIVFMLYTTTYIGRMFLLNLVLPFAFYLTSYLKCCFKREKFFWYWSKYFQRKEVKKFIQAHKRGEKFNGKLVTQYEGNMAFEKKEWNVMRHNFDVAELMTFVCFLMPFYPMSIPYLILHLVIYYWVEKYLFINHARITHLYDLYFGLDDMISRKMVMVYLLGVISKNIVLGFSNFKLHYFAFSYTVGLGVLAAVYFFEGDKVVLKRQLGEKFEDGSQRRFKIHPNWVMNLPGYQKGRASYREQNPAFSEEARILDHDFRTLG